MSKRWWMGMLCLGGIASAGASTAPALLDLRVDDQVQPLALENPKPQFSWHFGAAANGTTPQRYRVEVARSEQALDSDHADVWDSGWLPTNGVPQITYAGPVLAAATRYIVRVAVRSSGGDSSATTWFETAPSDTDWQAAAWIGKPAGGTLAAPLLRQTFAVKPQLTSARLYLAAGGYAVVHINGAPTRAAQLSPDFTDYDKRVLYTAQDVAALLKPDARNVIGIELGRGYFGMTNPNVWHWEKAPWHGEPRVRALLRLCYADAHCELVGSNEQWRVHDGPTRLDDVFGGEDYDFNAEQPNYDRVDFDDSRWQHAAVLPSPKGALQAQREPSVEVAQNLPATQVTRLDDGSYVFDFGRVISGWATLDAQGKAASVITLSYGEKLNPDGSVFNDPHGYFKHGLQNDHITLSGAASQTWHSRFSWKGFRYIQLKGWTGNAAPPVDALTAQVMHSHVAVTGHFDSSNALLNWVHQALVNTLLNNLYGIPTDTPLYEKNGWTGDGMLGADMMLRNLDAGSLLNKWVDDISDARDPQGVPLLIAPNAGWGDGGAPPWHAAYILVPWALYWQRGDVAVLREHAQGMAHYVDIEYARSDHGIADTILGDWVSPSTDPGGGNAPEDKHVAGTAYLYRMATAMAAIEKVLGDAGQAAHFQQMAAQVREAFNQRFFDAKRGLYRGEGDEGLRQTHQLLALDFGLVSDDQRQRVAHALVQAVHDHHDHLDTGALGTKLLLPVLTATGHAGLAWTVATQTTFPGWGFWYANGATSLWEHWKLASRSRGHYFLGTIDDWLYGEVAGLKPLAPGWQVIGMAPALTDYLTHAQADTLTPFGRTSIAWTRDQHSLQLTMEVPVGATAQVRVPHAAIDRITLDQQPLRASPFASDVHDCAGDVCFNLASGRYQLQAQ